MWGLCKNCRWWQIEPDADVADRILGLCIDEELQPYTLLSSGNGGCDRFMKGPPARGEGSSTQPPKARAVR